MLYEDIVPASPGMSARVILVDCALAARGIQAKHQWCSSHRPTGAKKRQPSWNFLARAAADKACLFEVQLTKRDSQVCALCNVLKSPRLRAGMLG